MNQRARAVQTGTRRDGRRRFQSVAVRIFCCTGVSLLTDGELPREPRSAPDTPRPLPDRGTQEVPA
jgi:hypothetical protein